MNEQNLSDVSSVDTSINTSLLTSHLPQTTHVTQTDTDAHTERDSEAAFIHSLTESSWIAFHSVTRRDRRLAGSSHSWW